MTMMTMAAMAEAVDGSAATEAAAPKAPYRPPPKDVSLVSAAPESDICTICGRRSHPADPPPDGCDGAEDLPEEPCVRDFLKNKRAATCDEMRAAELAEARALYAYELVEEGSLWALEADYAICECCMRGGVGVSVVKRAGGKTEYLCDDCLPRVRARAARLETHRRNG